MHFLKENSLPSVVGFSLLPSCRRSTFSALLKPPLSSSLTSLGRHVVLIVMWENNLLFNLFSFPEAETQNTAARQREEHQKQKNLGLRTRTQDRLSIGESIIPHFHILSSLGYTSASLLYHGIESIGFKHSSSTVVLYYSRSSFYGATETFKHLDWCRSYWTTWTSY
jgi:hypothetical protein